MPHFKIEFVECRPGWNDTELIWYDSIWVVNIALWTPYVYIKQTTVCMHWSVIPLIHLYRRMSMFNLMFNSWILWSFFVIVQGKLRQSNSSSHASFLSSTIFYSSDGRGNRSKLDALVFWLFGKTLQTGLIHAFLLILIRSFIGNKKFSSQYARISK